MSFLDPGDQDKVLVFLVDHLCSHLRFLAVIQVLRERTVRLDVLLVLKPPAFVHLDNLVLAIKCEHVFKIAFLFKL